MKFKSKIHAQKSYDMRLKLKAKRKYWDALVENKPM